MKSTIKFTRKAAQKLLSAAEWLEQKFPNDSPFAKDGNPMLPAVIADSIPKSGTHLLGKLLGLLGLYELPIAILHDSYINYKERGDWHNWLPIRESGIKDFGNPSRHYEKTEISLKRLRVGQSCTAHLPFRPNVASVINDQSIKHLFMVRDLRDCVVSYVDYLQNLSGHAHNPPLYFYLSALDNDENRILTGIEGKDRFFPAFSEHIEKAIPWIDSGLVEVIRYENLIGPNGGGSEENQMIAIRALCIHLGLEFSDMKIQEIATKLWGGKTVTMSKGHTGGWRERFTPRVEESFWEKYGTYMDKLGYHK
jgi:hypothetical protein